MKRYIAISFLLFVVACDTSEPPAGGEPSVQFAAVDASCTEAWLEVKILAGVPQRTVRIQRDSITIFHSTITASETLIVDEGLLPNRLYNYTLLRSTGLGTERATTQITTLDTTSHNFTWQTVLLGDGSGSALYDVALINDTLAYAVGEIYLADDPSAYNMARWNGTSWQLLRIRSTGPCSGGVDYPPLRAVWTFSSSNILFTDGGAVFRYDGSNSTIDCRMNSLLSGAINRICGFAPNDVYLVGGGGTIVRYDGTAWLRIESGTTVELNDVWGGSNRSVGDNVVLVAASNKFSLGEKKLLRIHSDGIVDSLPWPMQDRRIHSVWFDAASRVYTAGGGVFEYRGGSSWREITSIPLIYTDRIRGDAPNNIFVVGDFGIAAHFNGVSWMTYPELSIPQGVYQSVAVRGRMIMIVSTTGTVVTGMRE